MSLLLEIIFTSLGIGAVLILRKAIISTLEAIVAILQTVATRIQWKIRPKIAKVLAKDIMDVLFNNQTIWSEIVNNYMKILLPDAKLPKAEELVSPKIYAESAAEALARNWFKAMVDYVAPKGPITPEKGIDAANRFFAVNLSFQMSAWLLHWISDTYSLGSMKSFKDLPNAIMWSFGLGWLSWLVMGTPMKKAIQDPLEIYYNRNYQTERPTLSQYLDWAYFSGKSQDEIKEGLKDYGFNSANASKVMTAYEKKMSVSDGEKLFKYGIWDEEKYKNFLLHRAYNPIHADYLIKLAKIEEMYSPLKSTVDVLIDLAIRGQIPKETIKSYAKEIGMTDDEFNAEWTYRYYKAVRDNTLSKSEILTAYTRGLIDENTTREKLRLLGYFDDDIDLLLAMQFKTLSVAQIKQLYITGVIDDNEAIRRLTQLGYSQEDAQLLLYTFDPSLTPGQIVDAMFNGYISIPQALDLLKRKGYSDDEAQILILSFATPTTINNLFKFFAIGILSEEEVRERLKLLRIPDKEIDELFKSGGKRLTLKQLQDLFFSQQIHRNDVYQKLLDLGYDEQTAKALLDTYFKPYEIIKWDPVKGQIIHTGQIWE
jgi:hypothetical protein